METRGDKVVYGEYYRIIGNDPVKKSLTYLIGVSDWKIGTSYLTTQLVRINNINYYQIYICKISHTSSASFTSDLSNWEQLSLHLQEVRDDIQVELPLEHDSVTNTFSVKESSFDNVDGGYLSQDNFKRFSYKQDNYTIRYIGTLNNSQASELESNYYFGKYECMIANYNNSENLEIYSYFSMIYKTISDFDIYIKNDENLISDIKDNAGTFNIYVESNNKVNLQNNLGYTVYFNMYRTAFQTSFTTLDNPYSFVYPYSQP